MRYKEVTGQDVRPTRVLEIGEIPSNLPSAYDAVDGEYGAPSLVTEFLLKDFRKYTQEWIGMTDEAPEPEHVYKNYMVFFNAFVHDQKHHNTDWLRTYKKLSIFSAQGWIREAKAAGMIQEMDESAIQMYAQALRSHLEASEQRWGVEWLTSRQPIDTQDVQMMVAMEHHRTAYYSHATDGMEYFLNVGGDTLIRQIRLNTDPRTLASWQRTADSFTW